MKPIFLALCSLFLCFSPLRASPHNPQRKAKITKNEAEHLALKKFPEARVTAAKLETAQGQLVWSLQLVEQGKGAAHKVAVDATSGRIVSEAGKTP